MAEKWARNDGMTRDQNVFSLFSAPVEKISNQYCTGQI